MAQKCTWRQEYIQTVSDEACLCTNKIISTTMGSHSNYFSILVSSLRSSVPELLGTTAPWAASPELLNRIAPPPPYIHPSLIQIMTSPGHCCDRPRGDTIPQLNYLTICRKLHPFWEGSTRCRWYHQHHAGGTSPAVNPAWLYKRLTHGHNSPI